MERVPIKADPSEIDPSRDRHIKGVQYERDPLFRKRAGVRFARIGLGMITLGGNL